MARRRGVVAVALVAAAWTPVVRAAAPSRGYVGVTSMPAQGLPEVAPPPSPPLPSLPAEPAPLEPSPRSVPRASPRDVRSPDVRIVRVDTDALGGSTRKDAFAHAGGRTVVPVGRAIERGATSVGEVLDRVPGVRALDGIAGTSGPTRLNVAVRGASPRLSEDATVLLDEVPIAMAPYGQPELSLFPVSLFAIDRVDAVRSGATARFGPTTVGGVFNLVTKPIPTTPEIRVASRVDQWGSYQGAAAYGTTVGKFGVWAEYAPQAGRSFRDHSSFAVHGSMLKLAYAFGPRVELTGTTHGYVEGTEVPGGLNRAQYDRDPTASFRPDDRFDGWRIGQAIKLRVRPRADHEVALVAWYNRSFRRTRLRSIDAAVGVVDLPRDYHVVGLEPRYSVRLPHRRGPYHLLAVGMRGVIELGNLQRYNKSALFPIDHVVDQDTRLGAVAAFVEDELFLVDESVILRAGIRGELARLSGRDNNEANISPETALFARTYAQPLPSASIRYEPIDELSLFVGYSRSFKAPTFYTIALVEMSGAKTNPVLADSVEAGVKMAEVIGLYGEVTGWFRNYQNLTDEGEATVDVIGNWYGGGTEAELEWEPGELWQPLIGSTLYGGYAFVQTKLYDSPLGFDGNRVPWFPRHEAWGGLSYSFPWACSFFESLPGPDDCRALQIGADVTYSGSQFSYFDNDTSLGPANGATGIIPSYALVDVYLKFRTLLPKAWAVNLSLGVKNVANTPWFYRTDDLNLGILRQRPRTFFIGLDVAYTFFGAAERARQRREQRAEHRRSR